MQPTVAKLAVVEADKVPVVQVPWLHFVTPVETQIG